MTCCLVNGRILAVSRDSHDMVSHEWKSVSFIAVWKELYTSMGILLTSIASWDATAVAV